MVVSVSFRGVSVSYSGIDGAGQRTERGGCSAEVPNLTYLLPVVPSRKTLRVTRRRTFEKGLDESHMASQAFGKGGPDFHPAPRFLQGAEEPGEAQQ